MIVDTKKLVGATELLELLFTPDTRPSLRWLRTQQKNRVIPYVKIGHRVFFDPDQVRAKLEKKNVVRAVPA